MQRESLRARCAATAGLAIGLLAACGGSGDGTGPPPGGDDEVTQEAAASGRAAEASAEFETQVAGGNPDPVGALRASLEADPDVSLVEQFGSGGAVIATMKSGIPFGVLVAEQNRAEWTEVSPVGALRPGGGQSVRFSRLATVTPPIDCDPTNYPSSKKACVLRTTDFELFSESTIERSLQQAGFEIAPVAWPVTADQVVQLHQTLSTCGVLYILAHGEVTKNVAGTLGNHLVTEVELPEDPKNASQMEKFRQDRATLEQAFGAENFKRFFGTGAQGGRSYFSLSPEFFGSVQYPNTFVFINACHSAEPLPDAFVEGGAQPLEQAFREDNGAGAFLGWKQEAPSALAVPAGDEIFEALAPEAAAAEIDDLTVVAEPMNPSAGEPYTPIATVSPPQAGIEVGLTVRGSDGYEQDETGITGVNGDVFFTQVPGGQAQVTDVITASVGGASNSATTFSAVQNSPTLQKQYKLPWGTTAAGIELLALNARSDDFNLVCNNQKLVAVETVVKFGSLRARPNAAGQDLLTPGVRSSRR